MEKDKRVEERPPGVKSGRLIYEPGKPNSRLGEMLKQFAAQGRQPLPSMSGLDPSQIAAFSGQARQDDQLLMNALRGIEQRAERERAYQTAQDVTGYRRGQQAIDRETAAQRERRRQMEIDRAFGARRGDVAQALRERERMFQQIQRPESRVRVAGARTANEQAAMEQALRAASIGAGQTGPLTEEQDFRKQRYADWLTHTPDITRFMQAEQAGKKGAGVEPLKYQEAEHLKRTKFMAVDGRDDEGNLMNPAQRAAAAEDYNLVVPDDYDEMLMIGSRTYPESGKPATAVFKRVGLRTIGGQRITPSMVRARARELHGGNIQKALTELGNLGYLQIRDVEDVVQDVRQQGLQGVGQ